MGNHNQKRHLSQFFTPPAVVEFMFDLVGFNPLWKLMDPACGDGAFLKEALRRGAAAVAGVDIDPEAIEAARANLREFEGRYRLFCQDGLAEIECESGFWKEHYDLVIGNPPFASSKWRVRDKEILRHFTLAHTEDERNSLQLPLLGESLRPVKTRLSQVIEVLFLERFVQLTRPGGKVAIILPEGIFANSNLRYAREWLVQNYTIHAVIGLPRDTFRETGTTAKTAILYLEKHRPPEGHQVLLAEVSRLDVNGGANQELGAVIAALREREAVLADKVAITAPRDHQADKIRNEKEALMNKRLVLLYDSTIQPWHADLQAIRAILTRLQAKGVRCESLDTNSMPEQELNRWRDQATAAAIWRHQGIRQAFGSRKQGKLPYFGKQVPVLLVYEEGEKIPLAVYPHSETRGRTHTDFTIESFLGQLVNSLKG